MTSRKDAIVEYKKRPPNGGGAFAMRCLVSDSAWVGASTGVFLRLCGLHEKRDEDHTL